MNAKTNTIQISVLRENFDIAVTAYEKVLCERWEIGDGYWVSGDKSAVFCFFDTDCLSLSDLVYAVDNNISYEEYAAWRVYNENASEFGMYSINLPSWHKGCPRTSDETFERLRKLKKDFDDACNEARKSQF